MWLEIVFVFDEPSNPLKTDTDDKRKAEWHTAWLKLQVIFTSGDVGKFAEAENLTKPCAPVDDDMYVEDDMYKYFAK